MQAKFKTPCIKENLCKIREFVNLQLCELSFPEKECFMLVLAVDEVCANLIIHSNECNEHQNLEIQITRVEDGVLICITDQGHSFSYQPTHELNLDQLVRNRKKGGLGLSLVSKIVDELEYTSHSTHNSWKLFKKAAV